MKNYLILLR